MREPAADSLQGDYFQLVIPAKAGTQCLSIKKQRRWVPGSIADEIGDGPGMTK